ncbi:hypothetical protein A8C56_11060 [Niabella ginsenosidivorans]|uniref:Uncharacterized protein n=1 Tax=Niabella ginsenosidivorans TaxID=1176587 RepID=A0A1A9I1A4_9BACT|nr:PD40 domain-containing protein [Niabella ginsenosidivorans]ANH81447.1 hypothetical protein A8C56_11060 [Niabella ginsenosidivorans]
MNYNRMILFLFLLLGSTPAEAAHMPGRALHDTLPRLLGAGIISTGGYETHACFTPSGDTVYFLQCRPDLAACAICVSYKKKEVWSPPVVVPFSGKYLDVDPFVTKDGTTMYFVSDRPVHKKDTLNSSWDIWKTELKNGRWQDPVHLEAPVNSEANEYYPSLADNGTLVFGSSRKSGKGGADIYRTELVNGRYSNVENMGDSINTTDNEYEAFIAPDESYLIFMATYPNGLGNADFYVSYKAGKDWTKARKLGAPVNSPATEWAPKVTRDGRYFYFGSTRSDPAPVPDQPQDLRGFRDRICQPGNGLGDIYYIDFKVLEKNK